MLKSISHHKFSEHHGADKLIPFIRAAATIGFAIAPCSLGFVIIAVSEQLIHAIMVGDDPELLVSELQSQFPHAAVKAVDPDEKLVAVVVDYINRSERVPELPFQNSSVVATTALKSLQNMSANP